MKSKVKFHKDERKVSFFDYDDQPPGVYEVYHDRNKSIENTCFLVVLPNKRGVLFIEGDCVAIASEAWNYSRVIESDISISITFDPSEVIE